MIEYYHVGGQLMAVVRRIAPGYIWYVTWGASLIYPIDEDRRRVPDDIQ